RAKALVALGLIRLYQGADQEAETHLSDGLAVCHASGDALHMAQALIGLGGLATLHDDYDRGTALLNQALTAASQIPDRRLSNLVAGWVSTNLAVAPRVAGQFALAESHLETALHLQREAGYTEGV